MLSNEEAAYISASKDGIDLHKYLSSKEVSQIRQLSLQYPSEINTKIPNSNSSSDKKSNKKVKQQTFVPNYETEFYDEANLNNKAYPHIYVIENTLRKIILKKFSNNSKWWKEEIVPKDVIEYAEKIRTAESKHPWMPKRGKHQVYYLGLEELYKILNKHWDKSFAWIGNREEFRVWINELIPIRNMVAHNSPLSKQDILTTQEKARYITNLINTQSKKVGEDLN